MLWWRPIKISVSSEVKICVFPYPYVNNFDKEMKTYLFHFYPIC